ncbi:MAG: hypothetical protein ABI301_01585 [Jatrophihabitantaceae bacterium]
MSEGPVGVIGSLAVGTRGELGAGEVVLTLRGTTETYLAWSPEPLPRRTRVLVIAERGARTVDVIAFPEDDEPEASELDL